MVKISALAKVRSDPRNGNSQSNDSAGSWQCNYSDAVPPGKYRPGIELLPVRRHRHNRDVQPRGPVSPPARRARRSHRRAAHGVGLHTVTLSVSMAAKRGNGHRHRRTGRRARGARVPAMVHAEKQWINETHLQLLPRPRAHFPRTGARRLVPGTLSRLGMGCLHRPRRQQVIAAQGSGPYVALTAHLDTVIAPRNKDILRWEADWPLLRPGRLR